MNAVEQTTINELVIEQAVMKETQKNIQKDIKELKKNTEDINAKLDQLTTTLDNISGGKKALIYITTTIIAIATLVVGALNLRGK